MFVGEQWRTFKKIKVKVAESIIPIYPNLNKLFVIYTDPKDYVMGGFITQDSNIVFCFSKKLNEAQMKYPTTMQEHLTTVETFKYNHNIIHGGEVTMKTDHKNLTHDMAHHTSQWVLHPQLLTAQEFV